MHPNVYRKSLCGIIHTGAKVWCFAIVCKRADDKCVATQAAAAQLACEKNQHLQHRCANYFKKYVILVIC